MARVAQELRQALTKGSGDARMTAEFTVEAASVAKGGDLPEGYALSRNYPKPFNPTTQPDYSLPRSEHVKLEVFNVKGEKVRTLIDEVMPPGNYTVVWDADSDSGDRVASGVYLYRFSVGEIVQSKKMTLVK